jgi:DNA-binding NarL/FixJ family response regulator
MQPSEFSELKEPLERIAKILAGLLLRDIEDGDQKQKVKRLKQCGFENTEIAKMLSTTPNTVGVAVHSLKKSKKKTPSKRKE